MIVGFPGLTIGRGRENRSPANNFDSCFQYSTGLAFEAATQVPILRPLEVAAKSPGTREEMIFLAGTPRRPTLENATGHMWAIMSNIDPFSRTGARTEVEAGMTSLETVDLRHSESFRYYESDYPFEILHGPIPLQPGAGVENPQVKRATDREHLRRICSACVGGGK